MSYSFTKCELTDVKNLIQEYVQTLSSPIDSYLEDHILRSDFYKINNLSNVVGYFAILDNQLLTQFYVTFNTIQDSKEIFTQVINDFSITKSLLPTSDEFLISLALDLDFKINKQAYFFQDGKVEVPDEKLFKDAEFRQANISDSEKIKVVSTDFFDRLEERIENGEIFILSKNDLFYGFGIIEKSKLQQGYASIGMFTNEQFRQMGIGRTILHHLKHWCYSNQLHPIAGCWYYNTLSKQTLESVGMRTKTRLVNIEISR